jgi:hypothetical protein
LEIDMSEALAGVATLAPKKPKPGDLALMERKEELQDGGVWKDLEIDGHIVGQVKVAVVGQMAYAKELEKQKELYRRRHRIRRNKELNPVQDLECQVKTMKKICLKGWRGIEADGVPLDFDDTNKTRVLENRTYRAAITELALDLSDATLEDLEDDEKKSVSS